MIGERVQVDLEYWADATDELPPGASPFTQARRLCRVALPVPKLPERIVLRAVVLVVDGESVARLELTPPEFGEPEDDE
jgi:hypothetical protein